jgi:hypothetical protein
LSKNLTKREKMKRQWESVLGHLSEYEKEISTSLKEWPEELSDLIKNNFPINGVPKNIIEQLISIKFRLKNEILSTECNICIIKEEIRKYAESEDNQ